MLPVRLFLKAERFQNTMVSKGIRMSKERLQRRLAGRTPWTAPEVVKFHAYLESRGVSVDLGELTLMCARDWEGVNAPVYT